MEEVCAVIVRVDGMNKKKAEAHQTKWTAAYYPFDMISNRHSRTIICMLFDKAMCQGGTSIGLLVSSKQLTHGVTRSGTRVSIEGMEQ
jgi:hypothetical protein